MSHIRPQQSLVASCTRRDLETRIVFDGKGQETKVVPCMDSIVGRQCVPVKHRPHHRTYSLCSSCCATCLIREENSFNYSEVIPLLLAGNTKRFEGLLKVPSSRQAFVYFCIFQTPALLRVRNKPKRSDSSFVQLIRLD